MKGFSYNKQDIISNGNILNVHLFGAIGDGIHDDSDAIQSAIDNAIEGTIIELSPGKTYLVTKTLHNFKSKQIFEGNNSTIVWEGVPTYNSNGTIKSAPHIIEINGSFDTPINISDLPFSVGEPSSSSSGSNNHKGFTYISTLEDPNLQVGDKICIQAARNALAPESKEYWTGTPTVNTATARWAEILSVNAVYQENSKYIIQCIGTLTYPYYYPTRTEEDNSRELTEVKDPSTQTLLGYYVQDGAAYLSSETSTIRKMNFIQDVVIRNLHIEGRGVSHSGNTAGSISAWKGDTQGNTIYLDTCENCKLQNIKMNMYDMGRAAMMSNCLTCTYDTVSVEYDYRIYAVAETHTYTNTMTISSCWYCSAINCTTQNAGQSFDTTYISTIRCPSLFITIEKCTVIQSMNSAATNHSGAYGQKFLNCNFINCAKPLVIRSPYTSVIGCSFSLDSGYRYNEDVEAKYILAYDTSSIDFSEPTIHGCIVSNCTFTGGKGIHINPYVVRFFNYDRGNYFEAAGYVDGYIVPTITSTYPYPPDSRPLNILIENNTFNDCNVCCYIECSNQWTYTDNTNEVPTEYAAKAQQIVFKNNSMLSCGKHYFPIFITGGMSGIQIVDNLFSDCIAESPSYYGTDGVGYDAIYLIYGAGLTFDQVISNNRIVNCGGAFKYLFRGKYEMISSDPLSAFDSDSRLITKGNQIIDSTISLMNSFNSHVYTEYDYVDPSITRIQDIRRIQGESPEFKNMDQGIRWDFAYDDIDIIVGNTSPIRISRNEVSSNNFHNYVGCLLRSWTYLSHTEDTKIKLRIALYDYEVSSQLWEQIRTCWDRGYDDAGNICDFTSSLVIEDADTHEQVTYQPPINPLRFVSPSTTDPVVGFSEYTTIDYQTGYISGNVPLSVYTAQGRNNLLIFYDIPQRFSVQPIDYYVCYDIQENNTNDNVRINSIGIQTVRSSFENGVYSNRSSVTSSDPEIGVQILSGVQNMEVNLGYSTQRFKDLHIQNIYMNNKNILDWINGGYIYKSVTGNISDGRILEFTDGADNVPIAEFFISLNKQEGSGNPSPTNYRRIIGFSQIGVFRVKPSSYTYLPNTNFNIIVGRSVYDAEYDVLTKYLTEYSNYVLLDGSEAWTKIYTDSGQTPAFSCIISDKLRDICGTSSETSSADLTCSLLPKSDILSTNSSQGIHVYHNDNGETIIKVRITGTEQYTVQQFTELLSQYNTGNTPLQLTYKLAEPWKFHAGLWLSSDYANKYISTALGVNRFYVQSSTQYSGVIHMKYAADPVLYIDENSIVTSYYGTCSTSSDAKDKIVTTTNGDFVLQTGVSVKVKMTNPNTYSSGHCTLNVDNTGAITMRKLGSSDEVGFWRSDEIVEFVYDGSIFILQVPTTASLDYTGSTKLVNDATTNSDFYSVSAGGLRSLVGDMLNPYPIYLNTSTYQIGDRVRYGTGVYQCTTQITVAEQWNSAHWAKVDDLQTQINNIQTQVNGIENNLSGYSRTLFGSYQGTGSNLAGSIDLNDSTITPYMVIIFDTSTNSNSLYPAGILTASGGLVFMSQSTQSMQSFSLNSTVSGCIISWPGQISGVNHILNDSGVTYQYLAFVTKVTS